MILTNPIDAAFAILKRVDNPVDDELMSFKPDKCPECGEDMVQYSGTSWIPGDKQLRCPRCNPETLAYPWSQKWQNYVPNFITTYQRDD